MPPVLPIHSMSDRHPGLTPELAASYTQAARVCLDRHHVPPVDFHIHDRSAEGLASLEWTPTDRRTRNAWANEIDTTEAGAYACALAAVELRHGLVAVSRAETGTGADFYVDRPGPPADDLDHRIRIEISGTDRGSSTAVKGRLRAKLRQAAAGDSLLPAMAAVVGFRVRKILLERPRSP